MLLVGNVAMIFCAMLLSEWDISRKFYFETLFKEKGIAS
jgi:hypothetical protein